MAGKVCLGSWKKRNVDRWDKQLIRNALSKSFPDAEVFKATILGKYFTSKLERQGKAGNGWKIGERKNIDGGKKQ